MAASAAASDPAKATAAPALKLHLVTAAVLLVALVVAYAVLELSRPEKVLVEGPLEMPDRPASAPPPEEGATASAVRFTPEIQVEGPTTVVFEMERSPVEGWAGVAIALVHQGSGEVRQLALGTSFIRRAGGGSRGSLEASARVDRVSSGSYVVRLEPAWEPAQAPLPGRAEEPGRVPDPPAATIRIRQERRSPVHFWAAAALVALPALVQIGRRLWYTRRHAAEVRGTGRDG